MILALAYLVLMIGHQLASGALVDPPAENDHSYLPFATTKHSVQSNHTTDRTHAPTKVPSSVKIELTSELSVSPRIERLVFKESNYNVYPNTRPVTGSNNYLPNYTTWSQANGTQSPTSNYEFRPVAAPSSCYASLNIWREDQRRRFNLIYNQNRKNGTHIVDFRFQKPNSFIAQTFWSILPDGVQLYLLRQKELKALNILTEVQKRPCCYNNVYYDCVYPNPRNGTFTNW